MKGEKLKVRTARIKELRMLTAKALFGGKNYSWDCIFLCWRISWKVLQNSWPRFSCSRKKPSHLLLCTRVPPVFLHIGKDLVTRRKSPVNKQVEPSFALHFLSLSSRIDGTSPAKNSTAAAAPFDVNMCGESIEEEEKKGWRGFHIGFHSGSSCVEIYSPVGLNWLNCTAYGALYMHVDSRLNRGGRRTSEYSRKMYYHG